MKKFIDLGVSFFDPGFTLDPYPYLEELYGRDDILGFTSENLKFVFNFNDCREVLFSKSLFKEPIATPEFMAREAQYAERYPSRKRFYEVFTTNVDDMRSKALINRCMSLLINELSFQATDVIFKKLATEETIPNFVDDIAKLPMKMVMTASGLTFTEKQLDELYQAGCDFIQSHDNAFDENLVQKAEHACKVVQSYIESVYDDIDPESIAGQMKSGGQAIGLTEEHNMMNLMGTFITPVSNTFGISSTYVLRNLIRHKSAWQQLKANPEMIDDNVALEFLRRDNHVKSLSRQVHEPFQLRGVEFDRGDSIYIFYPGLNLDPAQWKNPLALDFNRSFSGENNIIFGGSRFTCIGRKLSLIFIQHMIRGYVENLPEGASVIDDDIELDGTWVAERVITKMPIRFSGLNTAKSLSEQELVGA